MQCPRQPNFRSLTLRAGGHSRCVRHERTRTPGKRARSGVDRFVFRGSPLDPADPDSMASERFTQEVIRQLRT
jgi:hypothetical protein